MGLLPLILIFGVLLSNFLLSAPLVLVSCLSHTLPCISISYYQLDALTPTYIPAPPRAIEQDITSLLVSVLGRASVSLEKDPPTNDPSLVSGQVERAHPTSPHSLHACQLNLHSTSFLRSVVQSKCSTVFAQRTPGF
ncbi:hypothetical protein JB92DRAFT_2944419 [Gautieria morchelliformis]|nr:hypothetical protein JB92DRAFT_2944419 [Gautieria morchelliformis]